MAAETDILTNIIATIEATEPPTPRPCGFRFDARAIDLEPDAQSVLATRRFVARLAGLPQQVGAQGQHSEALEWEIVHEVEVGYTLGDYAAAAQGIIGEDARALTRALTTDTLWSGGSTGIYQRTATATVDYARDGSRTAVLTLEITTRYTAA